MMKRIRRAFLWIFLSVLLLAGGAGGWLAWQLRPASSSAQKVIVQIRPGSGAAQIASQLERQGLIRSGLVFLWYAKWRGALHRLKAGEYRLSAAMSPAQIIRRLERGGPDADDRIVTIPEGFTLRQIAERLQEKGIVRDSSAFLNLVQSRHPPLSAPFPLPETGLEGYLYPETYRFAPDSRPERVAQTMLDMFATQFYEPNRAAIARSGHSLHEIVTIASLIEREAEVPKDRARIAGVIWNRLKRRMRLEIDATVLYALGRHKERVLYKDLEVDSPYNTYRHVGLPPGPIACPGMDCLQAALNPERHDYLYYVASPDGSHVFTRTQTEHLRAVARMRALRRRTAGGRNG